MTTIHGRSVDSGHSPLPDTVSGGAAREPKTGPPANWFSIDRESLLALAETSAEGDAKYGPDNWRKGLPVSNLLNHALDHLSKLQEGDSSEPHIQHAMWNLGKILWMAKNMPELVDVPMVRKALGMKPQVTGTVTVALTGGGGGGGFGKSPVLPEITGRVCTLHHGHDGNCVFSGVANSSCCLKPEIIR